MNNLFTIYGAAEILERDRRSVKIALRGISPDQTEPNGRSRWRLSTIVAALARYDQQIAARASNGGRPPPDDLSDDADIAEVERTGNELDAFIKRLRKEPDLEKRREMAKKDGKVFGAFGRALDKAKTIAPPHQQPIVDVYVDTMLANVFHELMNLVEFEYVPDDPLSQSAGSDP